jgi:hypothetical protein
MVCIWIRDEELTGIITSNRHTEVVDQPDRSEMSLLAWFQQVVTTSKVDVEEAHACGHFRLAIRIKRRGPVRESSAEFRVAHVIRDSMTTVRRTEKCRPCEAGIHIVMIIAYTHTFVPKCIPSGCT